MPPVIHSKCRLKCIKKLNIFIHERPVKTDMLCIIQVEVFM